MVSWNTLFSAWVFKLSGRPLFGRGVSCVVSFKNRVLPPTSNKNPMYQKPGVSAERTGCSAISTEETEPEAIS